MGKWPPEAPPRRTEEDVFGVHPNRRAAPTKSPDLRKSDPASAAPTLDGPVDQAQELNQGNSEAVAGDESQVK